MRGARRLGGGPGVPDKGRRARAIRGYARGCLLWLGCMPVLAVSPPRLVIKPHTVSPRYAYAVGGRSLRVERDCKHRRGLLRLDVQVVNRGTSRIDMPVQLRVRWPVSRRVPVVVMVPRLAPGRSTWVRVDLPFDPSMPRPAPARLLLALTAGGQDWNRLQLPTPSTLVSCHADAPDAVAHTREAIR